MIPRGGILIVAPSNYYAKFHDLLNKNAADSWNNGQNILLIDAPLRFFRDPKLLISKICLFAQRNTAITYRVYVCWQKHPALFRDLKIDNCRIEYCTDDFCYLEERIKEALGEIRLDWLSDIEVKLSKYSHGRINWYNLKNWIDQFEKLGGFGWIGINLLKALDFWDEPRLLEAFSITETELCGIEYICFNGHEFGKSGGVIQNLIQKKLSDLKEISLPPLADLRTCLETTGINNILYVEDCLLSATEAQSLMRSLLGMNPSGRQPKVEPLKEPVLIYDKNIQFRFGVRTEFGTKILRDFFDEQGLSKCIEVSNRGRQIEVLTDEGKEAFESIGFWNEEDGYKLIANPKKYMKLPAFSNQEIWGANPQRKQEAIEFCQTVGYQLFKNYLSRKAGNAGWNPWSEARVRECALGMRSLGLALAFAHSVPKASLPLFWAKGPVMLRSRTRRKITLNWEPLFINVN